MLTFVLVLVTPTYTAQLTQFDSMAVCIQSIPMVMQTIKAPPVTIEAPTLLCLPRFDPGPPGQTMQTFDFQTEENEI